MIRVEPDGESVIAGRGPAGATVELLRNGEVHARTAADATGLFAFVPPALPPGSHEVTLRTIAPDGLRQQSRESVTIVVAENRTSRPLVALTTPDKPTVVLSQPEAEPKVAQAPPAPEASASRQAGASPSSSAGAAAPGPRPEVDIAAVETEDGGRLYVSGRAAPGSTVRLYLNETFIAPGSVGGDGKVSFAIGRGMKPGDYRVRLDDIDPGSGKVLSRAEVSFNVPATAAASSPAGTDQAAAPTSAGAAPQAVAGRAGGPASRDSAAQPRSAQVASAAPASAGREAASGTIVIPDVSTAIVSRGDNLWRISHRIYGSGRRYTVIFGANHMQIRNPHKIYPGQVFVLPSDTEQKAR